MKDNEVKALVESEKTTEEIAAEVTESIQPKKPMAEMNLEDVKKKMTEEGAPADEPYEFKEGDASFKYENDKMQVKTEEGWAGCTSVKEGLDMIKEKKK
ncbi:hypothetical protein Molly5_45 [Maribacter phage Molly_5]|uniref:Uncharacterized protein n=2 Tax=Mollyvirus TaxID=2948826 RepID=A0A8E4UY11_9CAUD|nr:hypothetical protein M1M29_gp045 [Maribacter phage Molly_1]YP_010357293.1 hypothetical protein M1M30_gp044 [Maribacter phage Colly_1]QQO97728.1 hypothetical protein Molly2_45 [Maribacter phage Molly_2]QQO97928.1 hypothetical protein Molly3_45 [Maribacter phage Molly_3]QQO98128.1 hypothetical protein Molly4_45 [Maribacter phage Molly_4]QQO98328.1 hypothetical protein Molly5_45 [Maribacter phage Molly_5]QQO97327.1 hypothetical protein Colly1_44 [Maribacter phage Colly_1]